MIRPAAHRAPHTGAHTHRSGGDPAPVSFHLLGPLEVSVAGRPLAPTGQRQRTLLATLLLNAGHVVPYSELILELWPEATRPVRHNTLHAQVARLRQLLPRPAPEIKSRPSGYLLHTDRRTIDTVRFDELRRHARAVPHGSPARAVALLEQALSLWRGSALQDSLLGPRCRAAAARLEEARVQVQVQLAGLHIRQDDPAESIGVLRELALLHPLHEAVLEQLMVALHRSGRRAEALQSYTHLRGRLRDELGTEPSGPVRRRYLEILRDDAARR